MGLVPFVESRASWIVTHSYGTRFVDHLARSSKSPFIFFTGIRTPGHNGPKIMHDLFESFIHMLRLPDLMLAPFYVKPQHRDTIYIDFVRIDLAIIRCKRYRFTPSFDTHIGPIK